MPEYKNTSRSKVEGWKITFSTQTHNQSLPHVCTFFVPDPNFIPVFISIFILWVDYASFFWSCECQQWKACFNFFGSVFFGFDPHRVRVKVQHQGSYRELRMPTSTGRLTDHNRPRLFLPPATTFLPISCFFFDHQSQIHSTILLVVCFQTSEDLKLLIKYLIS